MKDRTKLVLVLIALVLAAFFLFPQLNGRGGGDAPPLSVSPISETTKVTTEKTCMVVQDCTDYIKAMGAPDTVKAYCEANLCAYDMPKAAAEVTP